MVKSQNGAGLWSDSSSSDGAVFHLQPIADFSANTEQICTGGSVQYTNLSANITGQTWYFTGGSPAITTTANPTVTYATAGTYAVKLVVNGCIGIRQRSAEQLHHRSVNATGTINRVESDHLSGKQHATGSIGKCHLNLVLLHIWRHGIGNRNCIQHRSIKWKHKLLCPFRKSVHVAVP